MRIIGLTGSIGMGKSTASCMIKGFGIPVHDSDQAVHKALAFDGPALGAIRQRFPEAYQCGSINRQVLGKLVFNDDEAMADLERILHPIVKHDRHRFFKRHRAQQVSLVVIDVPLLFETDTYQECYQTIVISAPSSVQARRVLSRPGMTIAQFESVESRQIPDIEKRKLGDIVISSHLGRRFTINKLKKYFYTLRRR